MPGAVPVHRRGRAAGSLVAVAAAVLGVVVGLVVPGAAAQTAGGVPGAPTPGEMLGFGGGDPFGMLGAGSVHGFLDSAFSLADVDPFTGALVGHDADLTGGAALAGTVELIEHQRMLVDLNRVMEAARLQRERRRAAAGPAGSRAPDPGAPAEWELKNFSDCGDPANTSHRARIELVDLFEVMCRDAEADGVRLRIVSAWRSPQHQQRLWDRAVDRYGDPAVAARWVARPRADGSCSSRHCSGTAIDLAVESDPVAQRWLHTVVGCWGGEGILVDADGGRCPAGWVLIKRVQLYGLIFPLSWEPWHLELGVPLGTRAVDCDPPAGTPVPGIVASIFRCRLRQAGFSDAEADRVAAEAVVVSRCESGWEPAALAFGGRYVDRPHPVTGQRYTARGVFQFIRSSGDRWIRGGWEAADDPVASTHAAVDYWLAVRSSGGRGWEPWACAAANDGFARRSVLPGWPGGPVELPEWAWQW